jgi:hypothetical protein
LVCGRNTQQRRHLNDPIGIALHASIVLADAPITDVDTPEPAVPPVMLTAVYEIENSQPMKHPQSHALHSM